MDKSPLARMTSIVLSPKTGNRQESEMAEVADNVGTVDDAIDSISQLQKLVQQLQEKREALVAERDTHQSEIDRINAALGETAEHVEKSSPGTAKKRPGRPKGSTNRPKGAKDGEGESESEDGRKASGERGGRGQTRATRNGKETGTSVMLGILKANNGKMKRADLTAQSTAKKVSSAYSSFYSLVQSGKIKVDEEDKSVVHLVEDVAAPEAVEE